MIIIVSGTASNVKLVLVPQLYIAKRNTCSFFTLLITVP